jgi:hypothetical protein
VRKHYLRNGSYQTEKAPKVLENKQALGKISQASTGALVTTFLPLFLELHQFYKST